MGKTIKAINGVPARGGAMGRSGQTIAGGMLYLQDGRPVVTMAGANVPERVFRVVADQPVPAGPATVRYDFASEGLGKGGAIRISIDGRAVGQGRIEQTIAQTVELSDTFDVGFDGHTPVTTAYAGEDRFAGEIRKLTVDVPEAGAISAESNGATIQAAR